MISRTHKDKKLQIIVAKLVYAFNFGSKMYLEILRF